MHVLCDLRFYGGYCGIQQHDGTKQQVLFSLWDHPQAGLRVQNRSLCDGVVASPFGGEGKGMGAYCVSGSGAPEDCELAAWEPGATYTFAVQSAAVDGGSEVTCWFHKPDSGWVEFARHFRPEPADEEGGRLSGLYSFIEDFGGNSVRRSGLYAAWVQESPRGPWRPVKGVRGTSTAEADVPNKRLAAVACGDGYQRVELTTGGDALPSCGLFAGALELPPAPALLHELRAAL
ncbi:unnamed protein product [Prorocentrum cordatum]|uniref:DUF5077 domain-containing protein n=1 Tax=Prorocentrum cordatum TaxID=2364126 RepID=A0ABN9U8J1_9DINO|nr:unnamed protein product [Polarella glacialis]